MTNRTSSIPAQEILRRRDMRDVFTFTIDPADAKDFDDALSFEVIQSPNDPINDQMVNDQMVNDQIVNDQMVNYRIGVHIADVSFYVKPGSKEDEDAYRRGTSVYLVDRVLPMLPERLCNNLCSLRPNEDKLCMSVIFTMDADANVLKYKICRTVIRSNARLNYDEAQAIISHPMIEHVICENQTNVEKPIDFWLRKGKAVGETKPTETSRTMIEHVICENQTNETLTRENRAEGKPDSCRTQTEILSETLHTLNALALKLRAERMKLGALDIEQSEMRFRLDKHGHPTEIYFEEPNEAHHLIEEFMLLANRTVARSVGSGRPFVYRVHDLPNQDKIDSLNEFRKRMGARVQPQVLEILTIRAQAKAVYSTHNIGHYGLAFSHYTHFTSPIRRYPDLMVHRLLDKYILTGKTATWTQDELQEICDHCSACEQEAAQAERDSIKQFQAMFMVDHMGETLPGHISGVTDFGLFVQLDETHCEGLVHISTIGNGEYWQFDEQNFRLVCENRPHSHKTRSKKKNDKSAADQTVNCYTLGDPVMVKVVRVDENRAQIDFLLV